MPGYSHLRCWLEGVLVAAVAAAAAAVDQGRARSRLPIQAIRITPGPTSPLCKKYASAGLTAARRLLCQRPGSRVFCLHLDGARRKENVPELRRRSGELDGNERTLGIHLRRPHDVGLDALLCLG